MILYSQASESFLKKMKKELRAIMNDEMGLELKRDRFLFACSSVPLRLVCFEGIQWGYFNNHRYEIGLNKRLMYGAKGEVLRNILRHELAHLITFLRWGTGISAHGKEFRDVCRSYGWTETVWEATLNLKLANEQILEEGDEKKIIDKVKKLLALAQSDNVHEAEMATLKANQLLIHHNLSALEEDEGGFDELYVRKVFQIKRATSKYQAIQEILQFFYVYPIFSYGKGQVALEVTGTKENVLIAEYVAHYLDEELERLYVKSGLRGIHQKKSFMQGVAEGYQLKHKKHQDQLKPQHQKALMIIENQLQQGIQKIYGQLSYRSHMAQYDPRAKSLGQLSGQQLTIHKGISNNSGQTYSLEH